MAGRGMVWGYCTCKNPATGKRYKQGECPRFEVRGHKSWAFIVDLPKRGGVRQQLKRAGFPTRDAAQTALEAELPRIREGGPSLADRRLTLGEYLDDWLRVARKADGKPWRPSTVMTYRASVDHYIRPGLGDRLLTDLRRRDIELWANDVRDGKFGPGEPLSDRSVHQAFSTLRTVLFQAVVDGKIAANPCQHARVPGPESREPEFWEPEQVATFLAHVAKAEPRLLACFQLAALHGPRRGELAGLKWDDVDLDAGTLRVVRNVTEADRQAFVGEPKTKRGRREIALAGVVVISLREHRKRQLAERLAAGPDWHDEGWLFPAPDGTMIWPHALTQRFAALRKQVPGLPPLRLHGLRHTAASNMLLEGVPAGVAADQLGHDVATLLRVYAHVLPRQRAASAAAIDRLYAASQAP